MSNKEYRDFEVRESSEGNGFHGEAIVFDQATVLYEFDGVEYKEVIDRKALDGADIKDVCLKYNHEGPALARVRNKSLTLTVTDHGCECDGHLDETTAGKDMAIRLRDGLVDKMSFAFTVKEDAYDRSSHTRTILKIDKLFDVSIVDIPAYEQTSVSARSYFEARAKEDAELAAKEKAEAEQREKAAELRKLKDELIALCSK